MALRQSLTAAAAASVAMAVLAFAPASASVTVGNADSGNCYPFSCGPTDGLTEYQQVYAASAFPGAISFDQISFTMFTGDVPGPSMDTGTYTVSFYYSTQAVGSLSGNLASNEGAFIGTLGTFNLSGPMPSVLTLSGSMIAYDPMLGDLLMDVGISGGVPYNGDYNQYFNADYTHVVTSRAWFSTITGENGDDAGALQTTFGPSVPEPASLSLFLGAVAAGFAARRRKKTAAL